MQILFPFPVELYKFRQKEPARHFPPGALAQPMRGIINKKYFQPVPRRSLLSEEAWRAITGCWKLFGYGCWRLFQQPDKGRCSWAMHWVRKLSKCDFGEAENVSKDRIGAGVGLLEVAQQASKPIEYQFTEVDKDHSYYYIKAVIFNCLNKKE